MEQKSGFTLVETIIVVAILGVVAGITIPVVIQKQIEASKRTKIKKSMTVYDYVINKMAVENNLKSNDALTSWAKEDCSNTAAYFKVVENLNEDNNCSFRVSDGLYWDISDIENPIIAQTKEDLQKMQKGEDAGTNAFRLSAWFDKNGSLRINDLGAATVTKDELTKLYNYLDNIRISNNKKNNHKDYSADKVWNNLINGKYDKACEGPFTFKEFYSSGDDCTNCKGCTLKYGANNRVGVYDDEGNLLVFVPGSKCTGDTFDTCSKTDYNYNVQTYEYGEDGSKTMFIRNCKGLPSDRFGCSVSNNYSTSPAAQGYQYDENGKIIGKYSGCTSDSVSSCTLSQKFTYNEKGQPTGEYNGCDGKQENCTSSTIKKYNAENKLIGTYTCNGAGNSCTSADITEYNSDGKKTGDFTGCDGNGKNCTGSTLYNYGENNENTTYYSCDGTKNINSCSYRETSSSTNDYYYYESTEPNYEYSYCEPNNSSGASYCSSKGYSCQSDTWEECSNWDYSTWVCTGEMVPYTYYYCSK